MISDESENFYVGEFKKGKYCGNGRLKTKSGDTMEGQWESGELHGYGKATFDDGDVYEGQWVHGSPTGHGKRVSSGNVPSFKAQPTSLVSLSLSWCDCSQICMYVCMYNVLSDG